MKNRLFKVSLLIIALCFLFQSASIAANYTAKRHNRTAGQKAAPIKCSKKNIRAIKSFNNKAEKKVEEYYIIEEAISNVRTPKDSKELGKEYTKIKDFFLSENFNHMERIYKKCNKIIPRPKKELPFWLPLDKQKIYNAL